jgi:hypothetical protein
MKIVYYILFQIFTSYWCYGQSQLITDIVKLDSKLIIVFIDTCNHEVYFHNKSTGNFQISENVLNKIPSKGKSYFPNIIDTSNLRCSTLEKLKNPKLFITLLDSSNEKQIYRDQIVILNCYNIKILINDSFMFVKRISTSYSFSHLKSIFEISFYEYKIQNSKIAWINMPNIISYDQGESADEFIENFIICLNN